MVPRVVAAGTVTVTVSVVKSSPGAVLERRHYSETSCIAYGYSLHSLVPYLIENNCMISVHVYTIIIMILKQKHERIIILPAVALAIAVMSLESMKNPRPRFSVAAMVSGLRVTVNGL